METENFFIFSASYRWTSKNADIFYTESDEILLWNLVMKSYVLENCGKEWNFLLCKQIWVCVFDKMADKIRRQALSVQENEELAEVVRKYPCLYDKSRKEYKDKTVVENAWKEVADQLDFMQNGEGENHFKSGS